MKLAPRSLLFVVVVGCSVLCLPSAWNAAAAAGAAPVQSEEEQARQAFQRGEQLYREQKYAEAAAAFEEGYRHKPSPAFLFDLAMAYRALGKPRQAIANYQAYLKAEPDAPDRSEVEAAIAEEQRKLDPPATEKMTAVRPRLEVVATADKEAGSAPTKSDRQPLHRKWWFWTATGVVAVSAVAIGLGVGLSQTGTEPYREVTWR